MEDNYRQAPAESRQTDTSCDRNSVLSGASTWLRLSASLPPFLSVGNNYRSVSRLEWAVSY